MILDDRKCISFHQVEHNFISVTRVWFSPWYFYASLTLLFLLAAAVGELFMKHFPYLVLLARQSPSPCPQTSPQWWLSKVGQAPLPGFIAGLFLPHKLFFLFCYRGKDIVKKFWEEYMTYSSHVWRWVAYCKINSTEDQNVWKWQARPFVYLCTL